MKVTYIDHMGTDLSVVNAARVSFGKKSDWCHRLGEGKPVGASYPLVLKKEDEGLIKFLARGCTSGDWDKVLEDLFQKGYNSYFDDFAIYPVTYEEAERNFKELEALVKQIRKMPEHWTPFGHTAITLHIKAPLFVARQLGKHQVGMVWNEVSRRYVDETPEFYRPVWRKRAENVKQGSGDVLDTDTQQWVDGGDDYVEMMANYYQWLLDEDVAPEQARMVLPQSMYTEWYWTGNLYGFANIFNLRTDSHTQKETQEVAHQIGKVIQPLFPASWEALTS